MATVRFIPTIHRQITDKIGAQMVPDWLMIIDHLWLGSKLSRGLRFLWVCNKPKPSVDLWMPFSGRSMLKFALRLLSTKGVKTVTNILNLSPSYSVRNESLTSHSRPWISGKCWYEQCWNFHCEFHCGKRTYENDSRRSSLPNFLVPVLDLGPTVPFQGPLIRKQASVGRPKITRSRP